MLVIQAPSGTQLEVPSAVGEMREQGLRDSTVVYGAPRQTKKKYQMHLKSRSGQISVFLINQETAEKTALHSNQIPVNGASFIDGDGPFITGEADEVSSAKHSNNKIAPIGVIPSTGESNDAKSRSNTRFNTRREASPVKDSSNKSPNPSSTVNATSATADTTAHVPAIRTLSPRKAAQNHLIVKTKRDGTAPSVGSPAPKTRKVSTGKAPVVENNIAPPSVQGGVVSPNEDTVDENKAINNKLEGEIIKRPRRLSEILGLLDGDIIPDVEQPLIRLSPPPNARDYRFNLDESEGASDLFE